VNLFSRKIAKYMFWTSAALWALAAVFDAIAGDSWTTHACVAVIFAVIGSHEMRFERIER